MGALQGAAEDGCGATSFPPPEHVTAFLRNAGSGAGQRRIRRQRLPEALARFVQRAASASRCPPDVWDGAELPPHLRMNFRVVDEAGRELAVGRDLAALKGAARPGGAAHVRHGRAGHRERAASRAWDFGDLPAEIAFTRGGRRLTGYPALVDEGDSVAIRLFDDTRAAAEAAMRGGVRRLMRLALKEQMRQLEKEPAGLHAGGAAAARAGDAPTSCREDLVNAIADRAFIGDDALPRNAEGVRRAASSARARGCPR